MKPSHRAPQSGTPPAEKKEGEMPSAEAGKIKPTSNKWGAALVIAGVLCCAALMAVACFMALESTIQKALDHLETRTDAERAQFNRNIQGELDAKANQVATEMSARIDRDFTSDQIHAVIEAKAKARIDMISAALIQKRVSEAAAPLVKDFADQTIGPKLKEFKDLQTRYAALKDGVAGAETKIAALQAAVAKLNDETRTAALVMRVEADDYPAYVELKRESSSPDKTIAQLAKDASDAVDARFSDRGTYESLTINDEVGEPGYDKTVAALSSINPTYRRAAMDMLAEAKEKRAIEPIVKQMQRETDLKVIRAGVRALTEITGQASNPLDVAFWIAWWNKNKPPQSPAKSP